MIDADIKHGDAPKDWATAKAMADKLELTEDDLKRLTAEVAESYKKDRGDSIIAEAFT